MSKIEKNISADVAFDEVKLFVAKHNKKEIKRGKLTDEKIKEDYEDVIEAVEEGRLTFDDNHNATYQLISPLYAEAQDSSLVKKEVKFKSRIKQVEKITIMDGIDPDKQKGTYVLKLFSLGSRLSLTEIKLLEDEDYTIINQICSVF